MIWGRSVAHEAVLLATLPCLTVQSQRFPQARSIQMEWELCNIYFRICMFALRLSYSLQDDEDINPSFWSVVRVQRYILSGSHHTSSLDVPSQITCRLSCPNKLQVAPAPSAKNSAGLPLTGHWFRSGVRLWSNLQFSLLPCCPKAREVSDLLDPIPQPTTTRRKILTRSQTGAQDLNSTDFKPEFVFLSSPFFSPLIFLPFGAVTMSSFEQVVSIGQPLRFFSSIIRTPEQIQHCLRTSYTSRDKHGLHGERTKIRASRRVGRYSLKSGDFGGSR